ncbi:MAG: hypothetical protein WDO70_08295 [Alphaproteobacteria bacterium]
MYEDIKRMKKEIIDTTISVIGDHVDQVLDARQPEDRPASWLTISLLAERMVRAYPVIKDEDRKLLIQTPDDAAAAGIALVLKTFSYGADAICMEDRGTPFPSQNREAAIKDAIQTGALIGQFADAGRELAKIEKSRATFLERDPHACVDRLVALSDRRELIGSVLAVKWNMAGLFETAHELGLCAPLRRPKPDTMIYLVKESVPELDEATAERLRAAMRPPEKRVESVIVLA